jgi:hypothetical protein
MAAVKRRFRKLAHLKEPRRRPPASHSRLPRALAPPIDHPPKGEHSKKPWLSPPDGVIASTLSCHRRIARPRILPLRPLQLVLRDQFPERRGVGVDVYDGFGSQGVILTRPLKSWAATARRQRGRLSSGPRCGALRGGVRCGRCRSPRCRRRPASGSTDLLRSRPASGTP